ncbi:MAG TPA: hypothetical protein VNO70_05925 [Blastocatellia bacterium]|nr:hypothetical protein [Blastocatellia bacterium]
MEKSFPNEEVIEARARLREAISGSTFHANPVRAFYDTAIITGYDVYKSAKDYAS